MIRFASGSRICAATVRASSARCSSWRPLGLSISFSVALTILRPTTQSLSKGSGAKRTGRVPPPHYREVWEGQAQSEGRTLRLVAYSFRQAFAIGGEPDVGEGRILMSTVPRPER